MLIREAWDLGSARCGPLYGNTGRLFDYSDGRCEPRHHLLHALAYSVEPVVLNAQVDCIPEVLD